MLLKAGRASEGLTVIDEAVARVAETEERFWEAEILRLQGELLLMAGAADEPAEALFKRSLDIARRQGGKSLELRAAMSLARLTVDLKDASALLDRS